jgi:hypothetical protein
MPNGLSNPETSVPVPTGTPAVVYSPIVLSPELVSKISDQDTVMPPGPFGDDGSVPEPTGWPAVVYSPIVLLPKFVSKIWARTAPHGSRPMRNRGKTMGVLFIFWIRNRIGFSCHKKWRHAKA